MESQGNLIYADKDYQTLLSDLKQTIQKTQIRIAIAANIALVEFYWNLGKKIVAVESTKSWGSKFLEQLSIDLHHEFPNVSGFSRRNLYAIRQWYTVFSQKYEFVPQVVAQLPWGHQRLLVSKFKDVDMIVLYATYCVQHSWSRDSLEANILSQYHLNAAASNNFCETLPKNQSDLAQQTIKNPYCFDFVEIADDLNEREIEHELISHISEFILELGKGFAFVGKQYNIVVNGNDYFIDMLFYHLQLRCYVVFELKAGKFKPEYAGKLNFYVSAVDSQLKQSCDNPTIGIILCRLKDSVEVEYALRDINKPIGVSEYELRKSIPENLKSKLPTVEELESEFQKK